VEKHIAYSEKSQCMLIVDIHIVGGWWKNIWYINIVDKLCMLMVDKHSIYSG